MLMFLGVALSVAGEEAGTSEYLGLYVAGAPCHSGVSDDRCCPAQAWAVAFPGKCFFACSVHRVRPARDQCLCQGPFERASPPGITFCTVQRLKHVWEIHVRPISTWLIAIFFASTIAFEIPVNEFWSGDVIGSAFAFAVAIFAKVRFGPRHLPRCACAVPAAATEAGVELRSRGAPMRDCVPARLLSPAAVHGGAGAAHQDGVAQSGHGDDGAWRVLLCHCHPGHPAGAHIAEAVCEGETYLRVRGQPRTVECAADSTHSTDAPEPHRWNTGLLTPQAWTWLYGLACDLRFSARVQVLLAVLLAIFIAPLSLIIVLNRSRARVEKALALAVAGNEKQMREAFAEGLEPIFYRFHLRRGPQLAGCLPYMRNICRRRASACVSVSHRQMTTSASSQGAGAFRSA